MKHSFERGFKLFLVAFSCTLFLFLYKSATPSAAELTPIRTPSTGYQPQFQVSGSRAHFVWHEYDGPFRQILTAEMNVDGSGWKAAQRTNTPFDKQFPQLQVVDTKIYYTWNESDGKYRQIWTAVTGKVGTGWGGEKRTKSPNGKYDPQFQIFGNKVYYVWHEDHGPTEPIWVAVETPK